MPQRRTSGAAMAAADPKQPKAPGERSAVNVAVRDFGGVNQFDAREAIADSEFYWLEEITPISNGKLVPSVQPGNALVTVGTESADPSLSISFEVAGVNWVFTVWKNSGNGWVGKLDGTGWVKIFNGTLTSGLTAATGYNNQGLLVVDPTAGYFDWNVTTANTVTGLSGQLQNPVIQPNITGTTAIFTVDDNAPANAPGSGGGVGASLGAEAINIGNAGTGYKAGDILTPANPGTTNGGFLYPIGATGVPAGDIDRPLTILVTTIGSGGAITGISILNTGAYQVVPQVGASAFTVSGGSGTSATFTGTYTFFDPFIIAPGQNYTKPSVEQPPGVVIPWYTVSTSGSIKGSSIATYAGRVWIGNGRTIQFTDIDSYSSFGNAGGSFTITDSWLQSNIIALFAANNYLYIFGISSIDLLSNVQIDSNDNTTFSRINVSASIGTTDPMSIFAYARTVAFVNALGFYVLAGATPEKISEKINNVTFAQTANTRTWAGQVNINDQLCPAFLFTFNDALFNAGAPRVIVAVQIRGRWFFTKQIVTGVAPGAMFAATTTQGVQALYGWYGFNVLRPMLSVAASASAGQIPWFFLTKLWDFGEPLLDKEALKAGIVANVNGASPTGITVAVETEYTSLNTAAAQSTGDAGTTGYQWFYADAPQAGGKYLGLTVNGDKNTLQVRLFALQGQQSRSW